MTMNGNVKVTVTSPTYGTNDTAKTTEMIVWADSTLTLTLWAATGPAKYEVRVEDSGLTLHRVS